MHTSTHNKNPVTPALIVCTSNQVNTSYEDIMDFGEMFLNDEQCTFVNKCVEISIAAQLMTAVSENIPLVEQFPYMDIGNQS